MGTRKTDASRRSMMTARPTAMPGEAPIPLYVRTSFRGGGVYFVAGSANILCSFYFVEFGIDQLLDRLDRLLLILAVGGDVDDRPAAGGEKEDAEDAFAVDFLVAFTDFDVGLEPRRAVDQLGGGTGMKAEFVLDLDVFRDQFRLLFNPPPRPY